MWLLLPFMTVALVVGAGLGLALGPALSPAVPFTWFVVGGCALAGARRRRIAALCVTLSAFATGMFAGGDGGGAEEPMPAGVHELLVRVDSLRPADYEGQLAVQLLARRRWGDAGAWSSDGRQFRMFVDLESRVPISGDVLYLRGELRPPGAPLHRYAFDPRAWSRGNGIAGRIYPETTFALVREGCGTAAWLDRVRVRMERSILTRAHPDSAGVLVAITTGSKGGLDPETRARFAANGAAHVLAVSGLHLGLLSVAVLAAVRWGISWITPLTARVPADRAAACVVAPGIVGYVVLTGSPASAVRAGIMAFVLLVAVAMGRRASGIHALCLAVLVMVGAHPPWLSDVGFQLSVTATLSLVVAAALGPPATRLPTPWVNSLVESLRVSTIASLATAPVLLWHFGQIPLGSPITNLMVVPPIALVALPCTTVGSLLDAAGVWGAGPLIKVADVCVRFSLLVAEEGSHIFELPITWGRPSGVGLLAWSAVALVAPWLGVSSARRHLVVSAAIVVALCAGRPASWRGGELRMHAIPVGQGDATLLEYPDRTRVLIDAGGVAYSTRSTGDTAVIPYLRGIGIQRLDTLVVTHSDYDHAGGVPEVILATRPREVWLPPEPDRAILIRIKQAAREVGATVRELRWPIARVHGDATLVAFAGIFSSNANDGSVVMHTCLRARCFLLTGDIEVEREAAFVASELDLRADVLKVPHHGSRTSSSEAFIDLVQPRVAVFHVGHENRFGFPIPEVLARYRDRAVRVRRTDHGELVVSTDGERLWMSR